MNACCPCWRPVGMQALLNHVLSGLLRTRSGRWLYFAFMHNHYQTGSSQVKQQMERLLQSVYEKY